MDSSLVAFLGVAMVIIVTPGQDTALTVRNTLVGGRRAGVATAAGVSSGQAIWTLGASLGLTAVLLASETLFTAVRLVGAAYIIYLGVQALLSAVGPAADAANAPPAPARSAVLTTRGALRQGVLSNLGNPKMAIFFSSLLPQFVTPGPSAGAAMIGLGLLFVTLTFLWLCGYAAAMDRARALLRRGPVRRAFDAVTGAVLVAFGARLAAEPQ